MKEGLLPSYTLTQIFNIEIDVLQDLVDGNPLND